MNSSDFANNRITTYSTQETRPPKKEHFRRSVDTRMLEEGLVRGCYKKGSRMLKEGLKDACKGINFKGFSQNSASIPRTFRK
jgi:hypothetical protein